MTDKHSRIEYLKQCIHEHTGARDAAQSQTQKDRHQREIDECVKELLRLITKD